MLEIILWDLAKLLSLRARGSVLRAINRVASNHHCHWYSLPFLTERKVYIIKCRFKYNNTLLNVATTRQFSTLALSFRCMSIYSWNNYRYEVDDSIILQQFLGQLFQAISPASTDSISLIFVKTDRRTILHPEMYSKWEDLCMSLGDTVALFWKRISFLIFIASGRQNSINPPFETSRLK